MLKRELMQGSGLGLHRHLHLAAVLLLVLVLVLRVGVVLVLISSAIRTEQMAQVFIPTPTLYHNSRGSIGCGGIETAQNVQPVLNVSAR